jgi:hypothetical protein
MAAWLGLHFPFHFPERTLMETFRMNTVSKVNVELSLLRQLAVKRALNNNKTVYA